MPVRSANALRENQVASGSGSALGDPASTGASRFDITEEDRLLRRATRTITVGLVVGVAAISVGGIVVAVVGWRAASWPLAVLGAAVAALAGVGLRAVYRAVTVAFTAVAVDASGVTLTLRGGIRARARWDDPKLRFILADQSADPIPSHRPYQQIPCQLLCVQYHVGLSLAAFEAIRTMARRRGVLVKEFPTDPGVRSFQVGTGTELATPFQPL